MYVKRDFRCYLTPTPLSFHAFVSLCDWLLMDNSQSQREQMYMKRDFRPYLTPRPRHMHLFLLRLAVNGEFPRYCLTPSLNMARVLIDMYIISCSPHCFHSSTFYCSPANLCQCRCWNVPSLYARYSPTKTLY